MNIKQSTKCKVQSTKYKVMLKPLETRHLFFLIFPWKLQTIQHFSQLLHILCPNILQLKVPLKHSTTFLYYNYKMQMHNYITITIFSIMIKHCKCSLVKILFAISNYHSSHYHYSQAKLTHNTSASA